MTPQEVFTKVVTHLLTQGQRSTDGQELVVQRLRTPCQYRGPRGLRCAVGCLIADDVYSQALETHGLGTPAVKAALQRSGVGIDRQTLNLLYDLQYVHDRQPVFTWVTELHRVSKKYGLRMPTVRP